MSNTLEQLRKTPNLKSKINAILSEKFIFTDDIADILASAIYAKQNVILYGPGGHGKSEMVEAVMEGLGLWQRDNQAQSETLIQSFGEGLTEDALWGGIDFRKLNHPTDPDMCFNVENSFLNYPVAVFEELFDAPAFCLLPLKHTLQAGFLAKNGKTHPMKTQLIIACTNRDPSEIAEMGETYRALLERFVLRQEVVWNNYNQGTYEALIRKHKKINRFEPSEIGVLARLMQDCYQAGTFISPRTAMKAVDIIVGAADARQASLVNLTDFMSLKNVAGFTVSVKRLQEQLENAHKEAEAKKQFESVITEFNNLRDSYNSGLITRVIEWCILAKKFTNLHGKLSSMTVPDSIFDKKDGILRGCTDVSESCMRAAKDATQV
jgi:hypothetical protein